MEHCPRCSSFVDTDRAYCQVCSRPRILESLRAPWARPAWQDHAWRAATVVAALWLLVTLPVAFLREAKAVRDSRQLLVLQNPEAAWTRIEPFLQAHPRHRKALFLCGQSAVRLGMSDQAKDCLDRISRLSPELAQTLQEDYDRVQAEQTQ